MSKDTMDQERLTNGSYDCVVNMLKLIDNRGSDKTEFIMTENTTIYWGELRRADEPYPTTRSGTTYVQTSANKATYWYGKFALSNEIDHTPRDQLH
jgi:hypothetical protein